MLLALCIGLALPTAAQARGRLEKEDRASLAQAEQLIEERKYNQAILALRDLLERNPDAFDAAEQLMQRIREARARYNAKFEELITALFEENNVPKGLALIAELEALDPYPNEAVARALEQAKVGRELVVNMNRFNRIMDEAAALLAQGRYAEANARYLEGFALGRESFDAADYGNILKNSALSSLASVQSAAAALPAQLERLGEAEAGLQAALQPPNLQALSGGIARLSETARALGGLEADARAAGQNFQAQGRQIGERPGGRGYDSFLFFGAQLVLGRPSKPPEGMVEVFAAARESAVQRQKQALLAAGDGLWQEGLAEFESGRYPLQRLPAAAALYTASLRLLSLWALGLQEPLARGEEVGREAAEYLRLRERIRTAAGYAELAGIRNSYAPLAQAGLPAPESIQGVRQALVELRGRAAAVGEGATAAAGTLQAQGRATGLSLEGAAEEDLALQRAAASLRGSLEGFDRQLLSALAAGSLQRLSTLDSSLRARYQEGQDLQRGIQTAERTEKYPDRALAIYNRLNAELGASTEEAGRLAGQIAGEAGYLEASPELRDAAQGLARVQEALTALQAEVASSTAAAQTESLQAGYFRQQGLLREQEVQRSLNPLREGQARDNLKLAQEAFDSSLGFQEDAEVRRHRDEVLAQLEARINQAVNERVVREVRQFLDEGRRLYSLGDYGASEQAFLRAAARWADAQKEPNPEVTLWLGWARAATENIAGREIALSNPLYPQMMQLYNLAFQEYQQGRRLVEQDRRQEALAVLQKAVDHLDQIKILFPYYSEAQILVLRIEQLRDQDRFREVLDASFRDALAKRELNPSEALNTLEVLRVLSPNYPGLSAAVRSLRIQLGLELPPSDPAKQAEARRLFAEAQRTYANNQRVLYPRALEQLNAAISLDPNFRQAVVLKDTLQVALGASRQLILSSDDQRRFREAEGFYLNGQYPSAYQIVVELLRKPANQGYAPLLELRANIEARL